MKTAIVVIDYGNSKLTQNLLASFGEINEKSGVELIILGIQPRNFRQKVTWIHLDQNVGFAAANNLGIKLAMKNGAKNVVLLNNDTLVSRDFLTPLLKQLENSQVGLVSPKIYFAKGHEYHQHDYRPAEKGKVIWYGGGVIDWNNVNAYHWGINEVDHGQFCSAEETDFATGCCLAFRSELIERVGLMKESYFLYWEDVEWSVRTKKSRYSIIFEPKSIIWHVNAGSTGGPGSDLQRYYQTRNRLVFGLRYAPLKVRLALIKASLSDYRGGKRVVKQALIDGFLGRMGERK